SVGSVITRCWFAAIPLTVWVAPLGHRTASVNGPGRDPSPNSSVRLFWPWTTAVAAWVVEGRPTARPTARAAPTLRTRPFIERSLPRGATAGEDPDRSLHVGHVGHHRVGAEARKLLERRTARRHQQAPRSAGAGAGQVQRRVAHHPDVRRVQPAAVPSLNLDQRHRHQIGPVVVVASRGRHFEIEPPVQAERPELEPGVGRQVAGQDRLEHLGVRVQAGQHLHHPRMHRTVVPDELDGMFEPAFQGLEDRREMTAGVKGIALVGAYSVLAEEGYAPQNVAGASAGAIVASLVAAGYSAEELHDVLKSTNFYSFEDKGWEDKIALLGKPLSIVKDHGLYEGKVFHDWIGDLLAKKGIMKFG